jgi:hypothetical protein
MLCLRFIRDTRGGVAPLLALAMVPIVGAVGAAVDYSRANAIKASMQAALDSAGLTLARNSQQLGAAPISAYDAFAANFVRPEVSNLEVASTTSPAPGGAMLSLSAKGTIKTQLMGLLGFTSLPVSTTATVIAASDGLGCVLALDKTADGAITGQGSTNVELKGCSLYDNSASPTSMVVGGSAKIYAWSVGLVGGLAAGSTGLITDKGIWKIGEVKDPYADYSYPAVGGCTEQNFKPKESTTISAGVYCGGISLNAGITLTLNPGIYYLDGGDLSVNGGATLTGVGVTLVFTKHNKSTFANATINGNANIDLTPPQYGPTAGIVMFGDRSMPKTTTFKLNGGSSQYLGGAIYLPSAAIEYSGGAATSASCTQIIGNTITFTGNSAVAINCSSYQTKPFSALTVRLAS